MKCPNCYDEMVATVEKSYRYDECGLDYIYLEDIDIYSCKKCDEHIVSIPSIIELNSLIGLSLIKKDSLLTGKEARYLRKNIGLSGKKLSEILGVNNATVSRWENNNQNIGKDHDRLIRLVYAELKDIPREDLKTLIQNDLVKINPYAEKHQKLNIMPCMWTKKDSACHV